MGGPQLSDIRQNGIGNCWLMAAMATVAGQQPEFVKKMVRPSSHPDFPSTPDQGFYEVDLYFEGKKRTIVVNDKFPFYKLDEDDAKHFWYALVEKAYAKHFGSYEACTGGYSDEALSSILGNPCWPVKVEALG